MKLYIFGNGFDLAHRMKTRYDDFIESNPVFKIKYEIFKGSDWNNIEFEIGEKIYQKKEEISKFIENVDADDIADYIISSYGTDDYGVVNYYNYDHEELSRLLDEFNDLSRLIDQFEFDFMNYLRTIDIKKVNKLKKVDGLFKYEEAVYINFNYTMLLEILYGINDIMHIHGTIEDKIKIGYNSEISFFDMSLGNLVYPRREDIRVESKHDLPDLYSYYEMIDDENGRFTGEWAPNHTRFDFYNKVSDNIISKKIELSEKLELNDKSKFDKRIDIMNKIKGIQIDEVIIIGHSLGEMDHDFFDEIFKTTPSITCSYYNESDYEKKIKIAADKKWKIRWFRL